MQPLCCLSALFMFSCLADALPGDPNTPEQPTAGQQQSGEREGVPLQHPEQEEVAITFLDPEQVELENIDLQEVQLDPLGLGEVPAGTDFESPDDGGWLEVLPAELRPLGSIDAEPSAMHRCQGSPNSHN